jgi:hypothetical protein
MRLALLLAIFTACSSTVPAGSECSTSSDCESGQSCLELGQGSGSGSACTLIIKQCSRTCGSDADCTSLGAGFTCFPSCGSAKECTGAGPG